MDEFRKRLNLVLDTYFDNKMDLAKASGVSYTSLSDYSLGKRQDPTISFVQKIAKAVPNLNIVWLAFGIGEPTYEREPNMVNEDAPTYQLRPLFVSDIQRSCNFDTMEPLIKRGDRIALVNADVNNVAYGRVYMIGYNDNETLAQLMYVDDDTVRLHHSNNIYSDYPLPKTSIQKLQMVVGITGKR